MKILHSVLVILIPLGWGCTFEALGTKFSLRTCAQAEAALVACLESPENESATQELDRARASGKLTPFEYATRHRSLCPEERKVFCAACWPEYHGGCGPASMPREPSESGTFTN